MSKKFEHGGPTFSHHIPLKMSPKSVIPLKCQYGHNSYQLNDNFKGWWLYVFKLSSNWPGHEIGIKLSTHSPNFLKSVMHSMLVVNPWFPKNLCFEGRAL